MTRDEFLDRHQPSVGVAPEPYNLQYERQEFTCDLDALLAATRREALKEAAKLVLDQAMQWDAPDADDPGCERTVLLNARNAILALAEKVPK